MLSVIYENRTDLVAVQGVLSSVVKITGEFTKIRYKGGNENKISLITDELQKYFSSKNYVSKDAANSNYNKELQDITLFFIINSELKDSSIASFKEYQHLINIIPKISTCVLANIIIELDLVEYSANIMQTLPIEYSNEIIKEIVPFLPRIELSKSIKYTFLFVKAIIIKLNSIEANPEMEYISDKLADHSVQMLLNMSGINPEAIQGCKTLRIYRHMAQTLLYLFELLKIANFQNYNTGKLNGAVIRTCEDVMKAVTLNIFCAWAELEHNGQNLQTVVATEAYIVVEKLQKQKLAKELLQMLGTIARKPKTLKERIIEADVPTIIKNIQQQDSNQSQWFKALLITQVFQSKDSMKCINQWINLCTLDDVNHLLNMCTKYNDKEVKQLVIKCASVLTVSDLAILLTRYFYHHGMNNHLDTECVQEQLVLLLNKLQKNSSQDNFTKEILLLLLQNPVNVLTFLYTKCLTNTLHCSFLKELFLKIKDVIVVNSFAVKVLKETIMTCKPTKDNIVSYSELIKELLNANIIRSETMILEIIKPIIQSATDRNDHEELINILQILNEITPNLTHNENSLVIIESLRNILKDNRCKFFDYMLVKHNVVQETVNVLTKLKMHIVSNPHCTSSISNIDDKNRLNQYYLNYLREEHLPKFLDFVYPNYNAQNYSEVVGNIIKLLPSCVTTEWLSITNALECRCGWEKTLELLTDTLVLLCQVAKTQEQSSVDECLKFCLQQYGIAINDVLQSKIKNLADEVILTKSVCRLLHDIPENMLYEEALILIGLLSDRSLGFLAQDKAFVCQLTTLSDPAISQIIAKRMLSM